jgi:hypothetical protein
MRLVNVVAVAVSPDEIATPDAQLAKHILAARGENGFA